MIKSGAGLQIGHLVGDYFKLRDGLPTSGGKSVGGKYRQTHKLATAAHKKRQKKIRAMIVKIVQKIFI